MLPIEAQKYKWKDSSLIAKLWKFMLTSRHVNTLKCNSNLLCYCASWSSWIKNKGDHDIIYFSLYKSLKVINFVGIIVPRINVCWAIVSFNIVMYLIIDSLLNIYLWWEITHHILQIPDIVFHWTNIKLNLQGQSNQLPYHFGHN